MRKIFGQRVCLFSLFLSVFCGLANAQVAQVAEDPRLAQIVDASGFEGTFLAYELPDDRYVAGHVGRTDKALLPASSFKIFSALVALETGVSAGEEAIIPWDGLVRSRTELNADLDLQTAFRLSAVPHFQELVRRVGHSRMQHFIDAVGYGNRDISGGDDTFWLEGNLRITPRQQIAFLVRLYRDELPFRPEVMAAVKRMMVTEQTPDYVIHSKTGLTAPDGKHNVGWWVGWVERASAVTFFVTALEAQEPDGSFAPARIAIAREALTVLGVLPRQE